MATEIRALAENTFCCCGTRAASTSLDESTHRHSPLELFVAQRIAKKRLQGAYMSAIKQKAATLRAGLAA